MTTAAWRVDPRPSFAGIATVALVLAAVAASFAYLAVDYRQLFSGTSMRLMAKFIAEFFPPDLSPAFVAKAAWGALQTFAVAAIGTLLAVVAGGVLALPAAGRFGLAGRLAARLVLNFLRSVPELVWAALMVIAAGLGPFAGTLALALHTTGVLGGAASRSASRARSVSWLLVARRTMSSPPKRTASSEGSSSIGNETRS